MIYTYVLTKTARRSKQLALMFILLNKSRNLSISCHFQAIDALKTATRSKPVAPMFMLLGKTQMKAKQFKEATESFEQALHLYVSLFFLLSLYCLMKHGQPYMSHVMSQENLS